MRTRVLAGHLVRERRPRLEDQPPWVLLHGFTQSPAAFDRLLLHLPPSLGTVAVALPGHGHLPPSTNGATFAQAVDGVARVVHALGGRCPVLGYSLGARLAFGLTARHPRTVSRLVAVGGHPGLEDDEVRAARREADEAWAGRLEAESMRSFSRAWRAQPLFDSQAELPRHVQAAQAALLTRQDPRALARALRQLSLATMPAWWSGLKRAGVPIDLMAGARDGKFSALARQLAHVVPGARAHIVRGAGHNLVLEAPESVARVMRGQP